MIGFRTRIKASGILLSRTCARSFMNLLHGLLLLLRRLHTLAPMLRSLSHTSSRYQN